MAPVPEPALFAIAGTSYCQALVFEHWNAAPGRFFVACRTRGAFTALLGNGVIEEFRTLSGPILLAPTANIGGVYDAGTRLADARDLEAPIDQGWPPLTVGIDVAAPKLPDNWIAHLLDAIRNQQRTGTAPWRHAVRTTMTGNFRVQRLHCSVGSSPAVTIIATDAPLLPQQLQRLADCGNAPITIAVSVGNRLPRVPASEFQQIDAVSEEVLGTLVDSARLLETAKK